MLPTGRRSLARRLDVRRLAVRHAGERRQVAAVVQAEVQLHRALRAPELRPREQRQALVDGRRVERVERVAEPDAVARRGRAAARQQTPEQLLVEPVRLLPVHPRQRRPRYRTDAEVVELAALSRQVRHDVAQAAAPRELRHGYRHELVPARHAAQLPALVVPLREGLELMSRHQLEKLRENRAILGTMA